ncbi:hypothetical protein BOTBODRAFT_155367 [Botryobasidium botryosum FD-172 SS1]|uniref:amidase n=1 Tax=Botryobasidium botryosum (strain FD-172 SS1) TaxID=930990 RepID=A0A067N384_BOTB1|nr:hypothetical protein BOTBODRAFT_155367 [Botryobasidium botryosum FD-172 SS1]
MLHGGASEPLQPRARRSHLSPQPRALDSTQYCDGPPAGILQWKVDERAQRLAPYKSWAVDGCGAGDDISQLVLSTKNGVLTAEERDLVQLDATELVKRLSTGQYTAVQVLTAFLKVAFRLQQFTNCLTEVFFGEGLDRAKELDAHFAKYGKVVGPLHGLPVSIKDHILLKGHDTSAGYVAWAGKKIADKDAVAVHILREAGAVFYAKTANPQTLLALETENNIYGTTRNPFNLKLSPGGSSGGESALISGHGSPLGIGTDIGGSVRIPAAFCGLYGLKPSVARLPHAGLVGSHDGMEAIIGAVGPIAKSARDLNLFCKVMLDAEPWFLEAPLLRMPWREDVVRGVGMPEKLCFAILWDDGVVHPHPPITAALKRTKQALEAAGHEVIDWEPVDDQFAWNLIHKLYFLDGGKEYRETFAEGGEKPIPAARWIMDQIERPHEPYTPGECFELNAQREAFRLKIIQHWNATKGPKTGRRVDGILAPTHPTLATPHRTIRWWGYTSYWNLVDYPGAIIPMGKFDPEAYVETDPMPAPRNETEKFISSQWSPPTYSGAPVAVQLVGRRHHEEEVLAMLNKVEDALENYKKSHPM